MFKHFGKGKSSPSAELALESRIEELKQELEQVQDELHSVYNENSDLRNTIKNMTFNDNEDVFTVPRKSDRYFGNITVADGYTLLRNLELPGKKINLAWEVIE